MSVAVSFEMEASLGGSVNVTKSKSKESGRSFGINIEVNTPGDLQGYDEKLIREYDESGGKVVPGKVDAYRFMTFYLEPKIENFDVFVNKVVHPEWLAESTDWNATAIRQAIKANNKIQKDTEKSLPWRVFHRVTFISRILPAVDDSSASPSQKVLKAANIDSNYELIKRLEPFVRNKTNTYEEFAGAVRDAIKLYMPVLSAAEDDIVHYMSSYQSCRTRACSTPFRRSRSSLKCCGAARAVVSPTPTINSERRKHPTCQCPSDSLIESQPRPARMANSKE